MWHTVYKFEKKFVISLSLYEVFEKVPIDSLTLRNSTFTSPISSVKLKLSVSDKQKIFLKITFSKISYFSSLPPSLDAYHGGFVSAVHYTIHTITYTPLPPVSAKLIHQGP